MGYKEMYESWLANPYFDEATKAELKGIAGNEKEIEDRFYTELEFGTAGLRGVIGAGTNRMNIYRTEGYPGTCQLYQKGWRRESWGCHRIRFQKNVTGIFR